MAPQQLPDDGPIDDVASPEAPAGQPPTDEAPQEASAAPARSVGHPILLYTVARILVFLAAAGILYLFGARGFLLLLMAVILSGLVSFILLDRLRNRVSERVAARMDASRERRERAAAAEDDIF